MGGISVDAGKNCFALKNGQIGGTAGTSNDCTVLRRFMCQSMCDSCTSDPPAPGANMNYDWNGVTKSNGWTVT